MTKTYMAVTRSCATRLGAASSLTDSARPPRHRPQKAEERERFAAEMTAFEQRERFTLIKREIDDHER